MGAKIFKSINILDRGNNNVDENSWEEKEKNKYREFDQLFYKWDINKNNFLDGNELIEALNSYVLNHEDKEEQIKNLIKNIDLSSASRIKLEEFRILMLSYVGEDNSEEELLVDIFKYFDKNLTSSIGSEELIHVFSRLGLNISKQDAEQLILEADSDGDNLIDFQEFCKIMLSK